MRPVDEEDARVAGDAGLVEAVRRQSGPTGPAQSLTVEEACADLATALDRLALDGTAPLPIERVADLADLLIAGRIAAPVPADPQDAADRVAAAREQLEALRDEVRRAHADPDSVTGARGRRLARQLLRRGAR